MSPRYRRLGGQQEEQRQSGGGRLPLSELAEKGTGTTATVMVPEPSVAPGEAVREPMVIERLPRTVEVGTPPAGADATARPPGNSGTTLLAGGGKQPRHVTEAGSGQLMAGAPLQEDD